MPLHINLFGRKDLSGEIYRQIRRAILDGILRPRDRLPPSRELARTLAVARATVVVAYEQLAAEGFVVSRQGAGTLVSDWAVPRERAVTRRQSQASLQPRPVWSEVPLPTAFDREAKYDFRTGLPDGTLFPHSAWRRLVSQVLRSNEHEPSVAYEPPAGHPPLREAIARHIGISRGIPVHADDVVVTNGTQQAIDLLSRVLIAPGDKVAVEDPCYEAPRRLFQSTGAEIIGVPVDTEGLVVDALPTNVKAIYITPSHQYPMTVTMSLARRHALLSWATRNGVAIIEDDYDGEFRFQGRPLEPLQTLDKTGRVIYVGSFSKTMLPRLRLGFVVAPSSLQAAVQKAKYVADWHTSTLEQAALARFIERGGFARHLRRMSGVYRERHKLIADTIVRDFEGHLDLIPSGTGLHLAALARSMTVSQMAEIAERAAALGVEIHKLSSFAVGKPQSGVVLGYGAIDSGMIADGLGLLRRCFPA